jgi:uncharacterized RDD family membrane protein YckC
MKCSKCGYLGFEHVDRCRNCGYDFSLTSPAAAPAPELPLRMEPHTNTLDDLSLIDAAMVAQPGRRLDATPDLERVFGAPDTPAAPAAPARMEMAATQPARPVRREELPLFGPPIPDDEPLITKASPPRPPLAVRRATPDLARLRSEPARSPTLDLSLVLDDHDSEPLLTPAARVGHESSWPTRESTSDPPDDAPDAGVAARSLAVVIDLVILAVIDLVVIYFTMQICGIGVEDLGILPKGPLLAFLFVQNGGYLVAFTAGGQTLGKMAAGIRVVSADGDSSLDLGHAFLRTLLWVVLAVPVGLGFLTALFSRDHRGLHDRFAGTRVVRATV